MREMIFLLLCLIYSLAGAEINTALIASAQNRRNIWLQFFSFLMVMAALKLATMPYPVVNMCSHGVLFVGYFLMLWRITGAGLRRVAAIYFFVLVLECIGDLIAILILALKNGRFMIPDQFEPEGMLAMVISNTMQVVMVHGWVRFFAGRDRKGSGEEPETMEMRLILGIHFVFMGLLLALSLTTEAGGNRLLPTLLALQVTSIVLLALVLIRDVKNQEIREMQQELKNRERRNRAFYQYYMEEEDAYQRLHKLRHDFHNHLSAAAALMDQGETERAEEIFRRMEEMLEEGERQDGQEK